MSYSDYEDYDDRKTNVCSNATDYTEDEVLIDFFDNLAEAASYNIREYGEFGSESQMDEAEDSLNNILELYQRYGEEVDFHEILDTKNKDGSEDWVIDLEHEVCSIVYEKIMRKNLNKSNIKMKDYITEKSDELIYSVSQNVNIEDYAEELKSISSENELIELLIKMKTDSLVKELYKINKVKEDSGYNQEELNFITTFISNTVRTDNEEQKENKNNFYPLRMSNKKYIEPFAYSIDLYMNKKELISADKKFSLKDYKNEADLRYNLLKTILIQLNIENLNNSLKFGSPKVNHLQKHLLKILEDKVTAKIEETRDKNIHSLNNLISNYQRVDISNKIIQTFKDYKQYEALFKNHKNLPVTHPHYFNVLENNDIEKIDDFFKFAIERNQIKLYAKRFLGSYSKLVNHPHLKEWA